MKVLDPDMGEHNSYSYPGLTRAFQKCVEEHASSLAEALACFIHDVEESKL